MAGSINKVILVGNLERDPEIRFAVEDFKTPLKGKLKCV